MSNIKNVAHLLDDEKINIRRGAIEQRGRWACGIYHEAKADGMDIELAMRRAISKIGYESGLKEKAKLGGDITAGKYGRYFCTKAQNQTFEKKVILDEEDHFECSLNYCPLLKAWQEMGCDDETCALLCDIAMEGDRGIAKGLGLDFELKSTLAEGADCCHLVYRTKK